MKKLLITGGHVTPALAVIDSIREKKIDCEIVFVGRRYINDTEKTTDSFEYQEIKHRKITFIHLTAGRLTRIISIRSFLNGLQIPFGFISAFSILQKEKPNVVLSFGGYLAVPIAIIAKLMGIKVFTHEQTAVPGLANTLISQFADTIFVSFPESAMYFKGKNVIMTGNPLRKSIFTSERSVSTNNLPCIYVTGGSIGAHAVNTMIEEILPELLHTYYIIHQAGSVKEFNDFDRLSILKRSLPKELSDNYFLKEHFSDAEIGAVYKAADIIVGRAGANTFFELVALKKPAIFIPLPWSAHNEQEFHANIFKKNGVGEVVHQSEGSAALEMQIQQMFHNLKKYQERFTKLSTYISTNAEDTIIQAIFKE